MTNKEAKATLEVFYEQIFNEMWLTSTQRDHLAEALDTAIKSLSTTPEFKDSIIEAYNQITDQEFEHTDNFWIVTPKGKKIVFEKKRPQGVWIKYSFKTCGGLGDWDFKCSNCEKVYDGEYNFCPNCGLEMQKEKTNE